MVGNDFLNKDLGFKNKIEFDKIWSNILGWFVMNWFMGIKLVEG